MDAGLDDKEARPRYPGGAASTIPRQPARAPASTSRGLGTRRQQATARTTGYRETRKGSARGCPLALALAAESEKTAQAIALTGRNFRETASPTGEAVALRSAANTSKALDAVARQLVAPQARQKPRPQPTSTGAGQRVLTRIDKPLKREVCRLHSALDEHCRLGELAEYVPPPPSPLFKAAPIPSWTARAHARTFHPVWWSSGRRNARCWRDRSGREVDVSTVSRRSACSAK